MIHVSGIGGDMDARGGGRARARTPQHGGQASGLQQPELCVNGYAACLFSIFCVASCTSWFKKGWRLIDWPRQAGGGPGGGQDSEGWERSLLFSKESTGLVAFVTRRVFSARGGDALGRHLLCEVCCQHNSKELTYILKEMKADSRFISATSFSFPCVSSSLLNGELRVEFFPDSHACPEANLCTGLCCLRAFAPAAPAV